MKNEIFINKAILKHNNKYDYSLVNYINSYTKVIIICPIHGSFSQIPNNHLRGSGCIDCGVANSHNKQKDYNFIDDFIKANNDKYDYSLVNYIDSKTKISVICKEHGPFEITPNNHKNGVGCKKCGIINRITFFIGGVNLSVLDNCLSNTLTSLVPSFVLLSLIV